jgi:hypothetical protein
MDMFCHSSEPWGGDFNSFGQPTAAPRIPQKAEHFRVQQKSQNASRLTKQSLEESWLGMAQHLYICTFLHLYRACPVYDVIFYQKSRPLSTVLEGFDCPKDCPAVHCETRERSRCSCTCHPDSRSLNCYFVTHGVFLLIQFLLRNLPVLQSVVASSWCCSLSCSDLNSMCCTCGVHEVVLWWRPAPFDHMM